VSQLSLCILSVFLSLVSFVTKNTEKSFLQNNPRLLLSLLSTDTPINISFPEPISFSDEISGQQAYFLFKQIFQTYTTFEFFPEIGTPPSLEKGRFIFKASWSFYNKNLNQVRFRIYFYVRAEPGPSSKAGDSWKIAEIKAERLY
jgi:hypothetical protein